LREQAREDARDVPGLQVVVGVRRDLSQHFRGATVREDQRIAVIQDHDARHLPALCVAEQR
jgi:hypothetical protein